eukprot:jgi/Tetstr1/465046/TSEL_009774.t1
MKLYPAICEFLSDKYLVWYGPLESLAESAESADARTRGLAQRYKKGALRIHIPEKECWPARVAAKLGITRSQLMCEFDGAFGPASPSIELDAFGVPWMTSIDPAAWEQSGESEEDDPAPGENLKGREEHVEQIEHPAGALNIPPPAPLA